MPHILVEYSGNLAPRVEITGLMGALRGAAVESGLFEPAAARTRALPRDTYLIADGAPENVFLPIVARIRAGRSIDNRKSPGESLLKAAKNAISALPPSTPIVLSVEVHEIDPEMLFRHITLE